MKGLVATCYKNRNPHMFSQHTDETAVWLEYRGRADSTGKFGDSEIKTRALRGDGDFRSEECLALLDDVDIVVTNPPFSLFREFIRCVVESGKKFLVLGPQNALAGEDVFTYFQEGKVWLGVNNGGNKWFDVHEDYKITSPSSQRRKNGKKQFKMRNINWYTNLDNPRRHQPLLLLKDYKENEHHYPTYENYPAIEVSRLVDIPRDYFGEMGVPITFLSQHDPDQFDIIGLDYALVAQRSGKVSRFQIGKKKKFARAVINRR